MKTKIAIAGILVGMSISSAQASTSSDIISQADSNKNITPSVESKFGHDNPRHRHEDPDAKTAEMEEEEKAFLEYMNAVLEKQNRG